MKESNAYTAILTVNDQKIESFCGENYQDLMVRLLNVLEASNTGAFGHIENETGKVCFRCRKVPHGA